MWDSRIIEEDDFPKPRVQTVDFKTWAIWNSIPLFSVTIISLALILLWGLFGMPEETPVYLNLVLCLALIIFSITALVYSKYRHSSILIGFLAIVQTARILSGLAWGKNSTAQQILASIEFIVMIRIFTVISSEYFGQSVREVNQEPPPLEIDDDAPFMGPHFLIDDNTGMIDSPDNTNTNTHAQNSLQGSSSHIRKEDYSSGEEGELEDMASAKEEIHSDESASFGEVPLETGSNAGSTPRVPPSDEALPLHEKTLPPPPLFSLTLERYCLALLVVFDGIFCILVAFESEDSPYINIGVACTSWLTNLFGLAIIVLEVMKIQSVFPVGVLFDNSHAHGLSLLVILGAVFLRVLMRIGELAFSISDAIGDGENPFLAYGIESFLVVFPLSLHFYIVYEYATNSQYKFKMYYDASKRARIAYYVIFMNLHLVAIGHAFQSTSYPSSLLTCSYAFALVSTVDLCLVIIGSLSPLFQLLGQLFNFGYMRHKLQSHKDIACSALIFASFHIMLHVIQWIVSPNIQFQSRTIYSALHPSFITGLLALIGFFGAAIIGFKYGIYSSLHLPFTALGLIAFFCHGYQGVLGSALSSMATLLLLTLCGAVYTLFFLFRPLQVTKVSNSTWDYVEQNDQFALLDIYYENCNYVLPGSYCNIFGPTGSSLSLFRGQPCPVFSSQERRLSFFVHCAKLHHHPSFLENLILQKPAHLNIQGPFQGQQMNSFLSYLGSMITPCDLYLCGWSSGVAPLFSLLSYFRENSRYYPIQRISCLITKFSDRKFRTKIRQRFDFLVRNWNSNFPVAIIEAPTDELSFVRDAKKVASRLYKTKEEEIQAWKEEIPVSKTRRWVIMSGNERVRSVNNKKVLFFFGEEFDYSLFPKKEDWQIFVESIPHVGK